MVKLSLYSTKHKIAQSNKGDSRTRALLFKGSRSSPDLGFAYPKLKGIVGDQPIIHLSESNLDCEPASSLFLFLACDGNARAARSADEGKRKRRFFSHLIPSSFSHLICIFSTFRARRISHPQPRASTGRGVGRKGEREKRGKEGGEGVSALLYRTVLAVNLRLNWDLYIIIWHNFSR